MDYDESGFYCYQILSSPGLYSTRFGTKENRIYIRGEFIRKKCKTAILLYCFHTAGVLHIFMLYNLLGPGISSIENLKLFLKENQIMK